MATLKPHTSASYVILFIKRVKIRFTEYTNNVFINHIPLNNAISMFVLKLGEESFFNQN